MNASFIIQFYIKLMDCWELIEIHDVGKAPLLLNSNTEVTFCQFLINLFFSTSLFLRSTMSKKWDLNSSEYWNHTWSSNDTQHYWYSDINITYVNYYLHQPQVAAIFISSYFLIFFLCMVGNTVVCFIVIRNKHMHTVTNFFILNLAISDLLVGIFCMPITLLDNIIAGMLSYVWYKDDLRKL